MSFAKSIIAGLTSALLIPLAAVSPGAHAAPGDLSIAQPDPVLPVAELRTTVPPLPAIPRMTTRPVTWPKAARHTMTIGGSAENAVVGGLQVMVGPADSARSGFTAGDSPQRVQVEIVDAGVARSSGYPMMLNLSSEQDGRISLGIGYGGFADAFGASWADRLTLVTLPRCALTTPRNAGCLRANQLTTSNDAKSATLNTEVDLSAGGTVLALLASGSSDIGDYTKTDFHPDYSWAAGNNSGDYTMSYPFAMPPAPGSLRPDVTLSYSSGSVDGQTVGVNVQPFWGEGWSYSPGYIERAYRPCQDDMANSPRYSITTTDNCWRLPNARMVLEGKSVELVLGADGVWRADSDDAAKIELLTNDTVTYNWNNEHWKVTTVDGNQYHFGLSRLPGWASGDRETKSVLGMPVFSNHEGEPCVDANGAGWTNSWCAMAYRWNLDYVVDRNGNTMSLWYTKETNLTALAGDPNHVTGYDRFGLLDRIEYGTRAGTGATRESRPSATPPSRVVFTAADRCIGGSCTTHDRANYPDTAWDLDCPAAPCTTNLTPSFWSGKRVSQISTEVFSGTGTTFNRVDEWALGADFPSDASGDPLWLTSITRTGKVGGSISLPPLQFFGTRLRNRADWDPAGTMADPQKYRMTMVRNGSGGQIDITYSAQDPSCQFGLAFPDPDNNDKRCFPRYWVNPSGMSGWAWWHKYVVAKVVEKDLVGGSPDREINYSYTLEGANSGTGTVVLWGSDRGAQRFSSSLAYRSYADFRGYSTVYATVGATAGQQSQTKSVYFRGLHGDMTDSGYTARDASVTNSAGETTADEAAYSGMAYETQTLDAPGGQVNAKSITDPVRYLTSTRDMTDSWAIPPVQQSYIGRAARERTMTWLPATSTWLTNEKSTAWNTTYGVAERIDDVGGAGTGDDLCTRLSYTFPAAGARYLAQYPYRVQTVGVACSATPTYPQDAVSDVRSYYDGATSSTTAPTAGNVTKVEAASSYSGSTPNYLKRQTSSYDTWGRVFSVKDGLDHELKTVYTQAASGQTSSVKATNALLHEAVTTMDANRGLPLTITDANGKVTNLSHDALGRLRKVWQPGHPTSGTPDVEYQYTLQAGAPSFIRTRQLGPNGNQIDNYTIYDGLMRGRQLQETAPAGKRRVTDTAYDTRGLAAKSSVYYDSATVPSATLASLADASIAQQTRHVYDGAGRKTADEVWALNVLKWRTTMSYGGDRTTVVKPTGAINERTIVDARGRLIQKDQFHTSNVNGTFDKTTYGYDRQGKMTSYRDAANNQWTATYDLLGRRIRSTDPDLGTSLYGFDAGNRQTTYQDARGVVLAYSYDDVNRKTGVFEGSLAGFKRASWTYDTIAKGQLTSSSRHDGATTYTKSVGSYDDGYRPLQTTFTVPGFGSGGGVLSYVVNSTYKTNGSQATMSMPAVGGLSAETLTNTYTTQGMPNTTAGLATYISSTTFSYDALVTQQMLGASGSRVRLSATYDAATRRLTNQSTSTETTTVGTFTTQYSTDYGYDQAGNVTSAAGKTHNGTSLAADQEECFRYDYQRRLTTAWTQTSGSCTTPQRTGADPYWRQWTFDTIGNRTTQIDKDPVAGDTTWTSTIAGTSCSTTGKAHQTTSVTATGPKAGTPTRTFCYDAVGNTTSRTSSTGAAQTLTWDKEGMVAQLVEGANTTSYVYDPDGIRLIARTPTRSILYLQDGTELELPTGGGAALATRYYSGVAVRDLSGLRWTAPNHQGSGTIQIDASTLAKSRRRFLPYGEDRTATPSGWAGTKGFVGGTKDNTGLTHLGAREYDPTLGRFVSADPIIDVGDPQQWNAYTYSNANPTTFHDPSGKKLCGDDGCNQYAIPKPGGGHIVLGEPQNATPPCAPNCDVPAPPTQQQQEWLDKYDEAVDNALKNNPDMVSATGLDTLVKYPGLMNSTDADRYQMLIDYEFCKLVANCLDAFKYFYSVAAIVLLTDATGGPLAQNSESADIVRGAVERQLQRGWDDLIRGNLSDEQRRQYNELIAEKKFYRARGFLGTALHNAVAEDLQETYGTRFVYTSNRNPDYHDTKTGTRIELTSRFGFLGHVARGGLYHRAVYVLYRGPSTMPGGRPAGGGTGSTRPGT